MTTKDLVQCCLNAYTRTENVHKKQSHCTHNNTNQNRFRYTFKQTRVLKTCFVQHVLGNTFLKTCDYMNICPASLGNKFLKTLLYEHLSSISREQVSQNMLLYEHLSSISREQVSQNMLLYEHLSGISGEQVSQNMLLYEHLSSISSRDEP